MTEDKVRRAHAVALELANQASAAEIKRDVYMAAFYALLAESVPTATGSTTDDDDDNSRS